jgi:hypothetical protein
MKPIAIYRCSAWLRERSARHCGLFLAVLLAGCGIDPTLGPFDAKQRAALKGAQGTTVPAQTTEGQAAQQAAPVPEPPKQAAPPPPVVSLPPLQLLGMSSSNVIQELGQPTFQRRDRNALLLRYRQGGCILDLFLYPQNQGGPAKAVDYIEARAPSGDKIETEPCIDTIRKSHRAG